MLNTLASHLTEDPLSILSASKSDSNSYCWKLIYTCLTESHGWVRKVLDKFLMRKNLKSSVKKTYTGSVVKVGDRSHQQFSPATGCWERAWKKAKQTNKNLKTLKISQHVFHLPVLFRGLIPQFTADKHKVVFCYAKGIIGQVVPQG